MRRGHATEEGMQRASMGGRRYATYGAVACRGPARGKKAIFVPLYASSTPFEPAFFVSLKLFSGQTALRQTRRLQHEVHS